MRCAHRRAVASQVARRSGDRDNTAGCPLGPAGPALRCTHVVGAGKTVVICSRIMHFSFRVPHGNIVGPVYLVQALTALHAGNSRRLPLQFGIESRGRAIHLTYSCPPEFSAPVRAALFATYPDAQIAAHPDELSSAAGESSWSLDLALRPDGFSIRTFADFDDRFNRCLADPIAVLLAAFPSDAQSSFRHCVALTFRPASRRHLRRCKTVVTCLSLPVFRNHRCLSRMFLAVVSSRWPCVCMLGVLIGRLILIGANSQPPNDGVVVKSLQSAAMKLSEPLFEATLRLTVVGPEKLKARAVAMLGELAGAFDIFALPQTTNFYARHVRTHRRSAKAMRFLLTAAEVATLWHPPTSIVKTPGLSTVTCRQFPPPSDLPVIAGIQLETAIGTTAFRGRHLRFGIKAEDRMRHMAFLGKTGQGKTTVIRHLAGADIHAGHGIALIDPHGDLFETMLTEVPRRRTNDIVLFDATDTVHPPALNPLWCPNPAQRPLVASGVLASFRKIFHEFWGPRLEYIFRHALLALMEQPDATLLSVVRLLADPSYRRAVANRVHDPVVRTFWQQEFASLPPKLQAEAIAPIQNKVGAFIASPHLRRIVGEPNCHLDLRRVMDSGQVLLVNLSKGRLGEDASALLGALLVSQLQIAAMSRADVPESDRRDFFVFVDEFQNFATESFATTMAEARKYRLSLTVANQYLAQLDEDTLHALFGNVGTLVSFQVGAKDAELLADQFGGDLAPADLMRLPRYHAVARLLIDGTPSLPFTMRTIPPHAHRRESQRPDVIRATSRRRYWSTVAV